jgi:hypothetical protein
MTEKGITASTPILLLLLLYITPHLGQPPAAGTEPHPGPARLHHHHRQLPAAPARRHRLLQAGPARQGRRQGAPSRHGRPRQHGGNHPRRQLDKGGGGGCNSRRRGGLAAGTETEPGEVDRQLGGGAGQQDRLQLVNVQIGRLLRRGRQAAARRQGRTQRPAYVGVCGAAPVRRGRERQDGSGGQVEEVRLEVGGTPGAAGWGRLGRPVAAVTVGVAVVAGRVAPGRPLSVQVVLFIRIT